MFTGLFTDGVVMTPYLEDAATAIEWSVVTPGAGIPPGYEVDFDTVDSQRLGLSIGYLKRLNQQWALYIDTQRTLGRVNSGEMSETASGLEANSEIDGRSSDWGAAIGFKYRWLNQRFHYFTVMLGTEKDHYDWDLDRTVFDVPVQVTAWDVGNYTADFSTRYLSVATEHVFKWVTVGARYRLKSIDLDGSQESLALENKSDHSGQGSGHDWTVGLTHTFNRQWDIFLNYTVGTADIDADAYTTSVATGGGSSISTLNNVSWEEKSYTFGTRYIW